MTEYTSDAYRRGLTLGLTMAEIFILILFLLLLLLLAYKVETEKEIKKTEAALVAVTQERDEMAIQTPEQIRKLIRKKQAADKARADAENQEKINASLLKAKEEELVQIQKKLETAKGERDQIKEQLKKNKDKKSQQLPELQAAKQEIEQLKSELVAVTKGVDPPCWYEEVTTRQGKRREKTHYLLDVAVHNEYLHIRVNKNIPLPGRAIDESGPALTSYEEEYAKLPLSSLPLATVKQVSLEEFKEIAGPIKDMGKNQQIRDYSCVFYAQIWDFTSKAEKERWKQAYEKINVFFYTQLKRDDPWEPTVAPN